MLPYLSTDCNLKCWGQHRKQIPEGPEKKIRADGLGREIKTQGMTKAAMFPLLLLSLPYPTVDFMEA